MRSNLGAVGMRLRRRRRSPMSEFDRLPPPLRRWIARAALPWSPRSVARSYARARAAFGSEAAALAELDRLERRRLGLPIRDSARP